MQTAKMARIILHVWFKNVLLYPDPDVNKKNTVHCLSEITLLWAMWPALFMSLHLAFFFASLFFNFSVGFFL